jgi:hypothetical protein
MYLNIVVEPVLVMVPLLLPLLPPAVVIEHGQ